MQTAELMVVLLGAVVALALIARRLGAPEPVVLVAGGFGLTALPFLPSAEIEPAIVLLVFLPPILFPAAIALAREDLRPVLRPIGWLSIGLVLATTAVVALVGHAVLDISWPAAVVLGAVLGPTDPVSATALLRRAGAPPRLATILEGESLVNDGTSLTVFRVATGAVGAAFSLPSAVLDFVAIAAGGAALGAAIGWLVAEALRRLDELEVESAIPVLTAYGSYVAAEALGISGILAVVAAGLVIGRRISEITSPETRLRAGSFWGLLQFLAVSTLFVLIGVEVGEMLAADRGTPFGRLALAAAAVVGAVVAARAAWMATVPWLLQRLAGSSVLEEPRRELVLLVAGGLRGAVSVALALAIPLETSAGEFARRDDVVLVALLSVVVLLVVPALALPPLLRRLDLEAVDDERTVREARARMAEAALRRAYELAEQGELPEDLVGRTHEVFEARIAAARDEHDKADRAGRFRRVMRELVDAEREELHRLSREEGLSGEALRTLERQLDLEHRRLA